MIYLDNNATTALDPAVFEAMRPYWTGPAGNPSSRHAAGRQARRGIDLARRQIADAINCGIDEIVFTASATEANNLAILGAIGELGARVLANAGEHPSCIEPVAMLSRRGWIVDSLKLDATGRLQLPIDLKTLSPRLAVVQLANGETGCVQDIVAIAVALPKTCGIHCDAVQALGKIAVDFRSLGVSTMSLSGHKIHGPAGVAALIVRGDCRLKPILYGGHQQRGFRPGTEPVALIVGLGEAIRLATSNLETNAAHMRTMRDRLESTLVDRLEGVVRNGPDDGHRLPNCTNLSFPGIRAEPLLIAMDLAGVFASAGAACSSGSLEPSAVLTAMGISGGRLHSAIRFSVSRWTTAQEIDEAVDIIIHGRETLATHQIA